MGLPFGGLLFCLSNRHNTGANPFVAAFFEARGQSLPTCRGSTALWIDWAWYQGIIPIVSGRQEIDHALHTVGLLPRS